MGHIFISYSHKDTDYAHGLADNLKNMGFDVWIDDRLDYGSQWPHEIQKQLDTCDTFILVMSPRSFASDWVQSELQRAKRKLKPIFPLLLEGDEPWLSVESTQYYDVRGGKSPDAKFYSALKRVVSVSQTATTLGLSKRAMKAKSGAESSTPRARSRTGILFGVVAILVVVLAVCAGVVVGMKILIPTPRPSPNLATATRGSVPISQSTITPEPTVTQTSIPPTPEVFNPAPDSSDYFDPFGVPMRLVPAREFIMGSGSDGPDGPAHTLYLNGFYIDKYEVTNILYKTCVDAGACEQPRQTNSYTHSSYYGNSEFDNYPVIYVDWNMAMGYCEWRGAQLPTEAQWEKAARGVDGRTYPWGEEVDCGRANYSGCVGDTTAVGNYENGKSFYGVYDMAGNIWEWVADWYDESYYSQSPSSDPPGPAVGQYRVLRGGSWTYMADGITTFIRHAGDPSSLFDYGLGFRCAMDATP